VHRSRGRRQLAEVGSPVRAGGRITGVDENLHGVVRSSPAGRLEAPRLHAGGNHAPWSTSVAFTAPAGTLLTIAASTGGDLAEVEAFATTGVRTSRTSWATCPLDWGTAPLSRQRFEMQCERDCPLLLTVPGSSHPCPLHLPSSAQGRAEWPDLLAIRPVENCPCFAFLGRPTAQG
jgi:hypothetical protein